MKRGLIAAHTSTSKQGAASDTEASLDAATCDIHRPRAIMGNRMPSNGHPLTFDLLDDLLLARERGRLPAMQVEPGDEVGPLVELLNAAEGLNGIAWPAAPAVDAVLAAWRTRKPAYRLNRCLGAVPATRALHNGEDLHWDAFLLELRKAMRGAGWPAIFAAGTAGALEEMQSNIHEHSGAAQTGVVVYRVTPHQVEWVVADRGIGVLKGFQEGLYPSLTDSGEALKMALTEGCSRLVTKGRGNGFRPLFTALSARHGRLRFRSDDQLLTINGDSPVLSRARLDQRAHVPGFTVNVVCTRSGEAGQD